MNEALASVEPTVPVKYLCGVPIAAVDPLSAAQLIAEAGTRQEPLQVHLCNSYTLSLVDRDPQLADALRRGDLNLPDGVPVAWLLRRLGVRQPVRGPGLVQDVARAGLRFDLAHYFWGGGPAVAERAAARLAQLVPGTHIARCESPPFRDPTDDELGALAGRVRAAGAGVIWVGMGTPRQDHLVPRLSPLVRIPVVPVGAAFDFLAGTVKEAPAALHGSGLEWAYRLIKEPRRLWRRYLIESPQFALAVLRSRGGKECSTERDGT